MNNDMEDKILEKVQSKISILKFNEELNNNSNIYKETPKIGKRIFATACASLALVSGIVFATQVVYNKVWQEPVPIEAQIPTCEIIENPSSELVQDNLKDFITEEEAINIAYEIMRKLNVPVQNFEKIVLFKYDDNNKASSEYMLSTLQNSDRGINITLNAFTGKFIQYDDMDVYQYKQDEITEEEAIKRANEICDILQIIDKNDVYEVVKAEETQMVSTGCLHNVWQVSYAKKYNGIFDKNTCFTLMFIVSDGKTIPCVVTGRSRESNFENNPIEISEQTAIEIATNKEKNFTSKEIISVTAEQSIEKMNLYIYCMENNLWNMSGYKIENRTRNVWKITIKHNSSNLEIPIGYNNWSNQEKIKYFKENADKEYYVDATTGEIIGGKQSSRL